MVHSLMGEARVKNHWKKMNHWMAIAIMRCSVIT
jgi:hypothetical protein